jgi:ABC-type proline/glycine betaine transport system permease subunit
MRQRRTWDSTSILAALLCVGPQVATSLHLGLPNDFSLWEWFTIFPIAALLLGMPQIVMLAFVRASSWQALRFSCVIASFGMLSIYWYYVATTDLVSSSTASISLLITQLVMAVVSGIAVGVLASRDARQ